MSECQAENHTSRRKPSSIRNLKIIGNDDDGSDGHLHLACSILEYFSGCHSLCRLQLRIPTLCWYESQTLEALKKLLTDKRELEIVAICFSNLDFCILCEFISKIIIDSVNVNENRSCYFYFSGFRRIETNGSNLALERFRTKIRGTNGVRGYGIDKQDETFSVWVRI